MEATVIVNALRSPMGRGEPGGAFERLDAAGLLAQVLVAVLEVTGLDPVLVDEMIVGNLWHPSGGAGASAGIGRAARAAAGLPEHLPVTTVGRRAGTGGHLIHRAVEAVRSGKRELVLVGGVELVSALPAGVSRLVRYLFGQDEIHQAPEVVQQVLAAERTAARRGFDRQQLDDYAARSGQRAAEVAAMAEFRPEIAPVSVRHAHDTTTVTADETVGARCVVAQFPGGARCTAGHTLKAADGASAMIIASERRAAALGLRPRARFSALAEVPEAPVESGEGSVRATREVLARTGLPVDGLDHYEIGEDFASIPLAWQQEFDADPDRLNPRGGSISLGHPGCAAEVRSLVTMLGALDATGGRFGLQAMEGARGAGNAAIVERLPARRHEHIRTPRDSVAPTR
jgi:acetyl-CoA acyltransferase